MVTVGIDPGQHCGLAVYVDGVLCELHTLPPHKLLAWLDDAWLDGATDGARALGGVIAEDSRMQSFVWNAAGKTRSEGALRIARNLGMVDGICAMLEAWCADRGVGFLGISPKAKGAKQTASDMAYAGWKGRSNQHERDAVAVSWRWRLARLECPQKPAKRAQKARTQPRCYVDSFAPQNAPKRQTEASLPALDDGSG